MKNRRKRVAMLKRLLIAEILIVGILLLVLLAFHEKGKQNKEAVSSKGETTTVTATITPPKEDELIPSEEDKTEEAVKELIAEADALFLGYDYEKAVAILKDSPLYAEKNQEIVTALEGYEKAHKFWVPYGAYQKVEEINHVFVHSLIYDTKKAFDGDYKEKGYNYYMTTVSEFEKMLSQMYNQGYVLVSIHDLFQEVKKEDGSTVMEATEILLPPDKKPFVLSQDDVCYYEYMEGDGFASRLAVGKDGKPTAVIQLEDGSEKEGDYDMVPIVDRFVEEHPDFSYHNAKGIICLTGYEGILGYRTSPDHKKDNDYEEHRKQAKETADAMKKEGWLFASHSNGHRNLTEETAKFLRYDTEKWQENVASLVGDTDIYVYPFGADIQPGIKAYNNEKYQILKEAGFRIFCGVQAKPWMQIKKDYVRMQRRPLDGMAMLLYPDRLKDLFDLSTIIDSTRPAMTQ